MIKNYLEHHFEGTDADESFRIEMLNFLFTGRALDLEAIEEHAITWANK